MRLSVIEVAALRSLLTAFVLLAALYAGVATATERRAGPRWLPAVWLGGVAGVLALAFVGWHRRPGPPLVGVMWPTLLAVGIVGFGLPLALATAAVWRLGRRAARRRSPVAQWAAGVAAFLVGAPVGIMASIALEVVLG